MSQTALQYKSAVVKPAGLSWTQAAVNGLLARVGYSTDSTPNPYWDAIVLEAAVTDDVVTYNDARTAAQARGDLSTGSDAPATAWLRAPALEAWNLAWSQPSIEWLRIYSSALTQAQIQADMNTPLGGGALAAMNLSSALSVQPLCLAGLVTRPELAAWVCSSG